MADYTATFETALPPEFRDAAQGWLAHRSVLSMPYTLRMFGLRILMFVGARVVTEDHGMRDSAARGLASALEGFDGAVEALRAPKRALSAHPRLVAFVEGILADDQAAARALQTFSDTVHALAQDSMDGIGTVAAYDAAMIAFYDDFVPQMARLEKAMTAASAQDRQDADRAALTARDDATGACGEIETIAKTIRMISLNARVEAARAGDAGRAFGVIAAEIKSLSEQTEAASARVGAAMEAIVSRLHTT